MINETSLLAFKEVRKDLGDKQFEVYKALKELKCASNEEIAEHLNWKINSVTGRMKELRDKLRLVGFSHYGVNRCGRKVCLWKIVK